MKMREMMVPGAALLLLAAGPAVAGSSTAAEREATRQLNLGQSQMAPQPGPQFTDATAGQPAGSPPAAAPTARVETISGDAPILSSITNPPARIASANVLDASGATIGAVQRVEVTPQGQPVRVAIALIGTDDRLVVLDAGAVTYDASRNQILAQQSADQIRSQNSSAAPTG